MKGGSRCGWRAIHVREALLSEEYSFSNAKLGLHREMNPDLIPGSYKTRDREAAAQHPLNRRHHSTRMKMSSETSSMFFPRESTFCK